MKKKTLITWIIVLLCIIGLVVLLQQCNHEDLTTFKMAEVSEITFEELLSAPYVTMDQWSFLDMWQVDSHGVKSDQTHAEDGFYLEMAEEFREILEGVTLHTYVPEETVRNYDKHVKELLWENDVYPIKLSMTTGVLYNVQRAEDNLEPRFVRLYGLDGSRYYLTIGYSDGIEPDITAYAFYIDDPIAISQLAAFTYRIVEKYPGETEGVAVGGVLKPMVFVNDKLYESADYASGYSQISSDCACLGEITECVGYGNAPTQNFQANHAPVGTKVYQYYSVILLEENGKYYAFTEVPEAPNFFAFDESLKVSYQDYHCVEETGEWEKEAKEIHLTEEKTQILLDLLEPYADTLTSDVLKCDYFRYYSITIDDRMTLTIDPELGNYGENGDSYMLVMEHRPGAYIKGTYIDAELVNFLAEQRVMDEPPALTVTYGEQTIEKPRCGMLSWEYTEENGSKSAKQGDGAHPLDAKQSSPFLTLDPYAKDPVEIWLHWDLVPDSVLVRYWDESCWGQTEAGAAGSIQLKAGREATNAYRLVPQEGNYIYEVIATWESAPNYNGTVCYNFHTVLTDREPSDQEIYEKYISAFPRSNHAYMDLDDDGRQELVISQRNGEKEIVTISDGEIVSILSDCCLFLCQDGVVGRYSEGGGGCTVFYYKIENHEAVILDVIMTTFPDDAWYHSTDANMQYVTAQDMTRVAEEDALRICEQHALLEDSVIAYYPAAFYRNGE